MAWANRCKESRKLTTACFTTICTSHISFTLRIIYSAYLSSILSELCFLVITLDSLIKTKIIVPFDGCLLRTPRQVEKMSGVVNLMLLTQPRRSGIKHQSGLHSLFHAFSTFAIVIVKHQSDNTITSESDHFWLRLNTSPGLVSYPFLRLN